MFTPGLLSIILITRLYLYLLFQGQKFAFLRGWGRGKSHRAPVVDVQVQARTWLRVAFCFRAHHLACGVKYIVYLDG